MAGEPESPGMHASPFPWRTPLARDWVERWRAVDKCVRSLATNGSSNIPIADLGCALRSLANEQLGPREQIKLENTAARLSAFADRLPLRRFRLGLVGSLTMDFLARPLQAAGLARGLLLDVVVAPFDAVAGYALGETDPFAGRSLDAVVVVLDAEKTAGAGLLLDGEAEDAALRDAGLQLKRTAAAIREKAGAAPIVATLVPALPLSDADLAMPGAGARFSRRLNDLVVEGARQGDWTLWALAELAAQIGLNHWRDPVQYLTAKAPFAMDLCPVVADHLCALVAAMCGKSGRAIVLDLDDTLWGGVIGDDGISGVRIGQGSPEGEAFSEFQRFVLKLRDRGIAIAVCSKNNAQTALEALRSHPDMLVKEHHLAAFQINWEDKASNLRAIAEALNLGLDALVFIDDNPAERAWVRQALPLVNVPEIGNDPAFYPAIITRSGVFQHLVLNREDIARVHDFEATAQRAQLQSRSENYEEYLASLEMVMSVSRFDALGRARIVQLLNKTNQFNLTTRRYGEADVRQFEEDRAGTLCWQVRLRDRFTNHGIVGVVIVRKNATVWTIDSWLMSCRVLRRRLEHAVMNRLMQEAGAENVDLVIGEYVATPRNTMVADFYPELGFAADTEGVGHGAATFSCAPCAFKTLETPISIEG